MNYTYDTIVRIANRVEHQRIAGRTTDVGSMVGKTFTSIHRVREEPYQVGDDEALVFVVENTGGLFVFYHDRDCCESVTIEDIAGNLADLVGTPLLQAEESIDESDPEDDESYTWTFYRFATIKGSVVVRWYGSSEYYGERVDVVFIPPDRLPAPEQDLVHHEN